MPTDSSYKMYLGNTRVDYTPEFITPTSDTNFIVSMRNENVFRSNNEEEILVKINKRGCFNWSRKIINETSLFGVVPLRKFELLDIKPNNEGGVFILSTSADSLYNSVNNIGNVTGNGILAWQYSYTDVTQVRLKRFTKSTNDNSIILAGAVFPNNLVFLKVDTLGNQQWSKNIKIDKSNQAFIELTGLTSLHNAIYATGYYIDTIINGSYIRRNFLVKLSQITGNVIWAKSYPSNFDAFTEIQTYKNSLYITSNKPQFIQIDTSGNVIRSIEPQLNFPNIGVFETVRFEPIDENYFLFVARTKKTLTLQPYFQYHSFIAKINYNGTVLFAKEYSSFFRDYFISATAGKNGEINLLGKGFNDIEKADIKSRNPFIEKITSSGFSTSCLYTSIQASSYISSLSNNNLPYIIDTVITFFQRVTKSVNTNKYIESLYECPRYFKGCNNIILQPVDTICNLNKIYKIKYTKGEGCLVRPTLNYDSTKIQILSILDSIISFKFLSYGSSKLKASLSADCITYFDSIQLVSIDKRVSSFTLGNDIEICNGQTVTLTPGNDYISYVWQNNSTLDSFKVSSTGIYHVTATDNCGNLYSDTVLVLAKNTIDINILVDTVKCNKDSIFLYAPPNFLNYSWSPNYNIANSGLPNAIVFPDKDTSYYLTVTNSSGCIGKDTIKVRVNKSPHINLGNDTTICTNNTLQLNAGNGFVSYQWNTNVTTSSILVNTSNEYYVTAIDRNNCESSDTIKVFTKETPSFSLGKDTTLCEGQVLKLNSPVTGNYLWQNGTTQNQLSIIKSGLHWLQVENNGCLFRDSITVNFNALPIVSFPADTILCDNATLLLNALQNNNTATYMWQNGSNQPTFSVVSPGKYIVKVTNKECVVFDTSIVSIQQTPIPIIKDTLKCKNDAIFLNAFFPNSSYLWQNFSVTVDLKVIDTGTYYCKVSNYCGVATNKYKVMNKTCECEITMPNIFSPNGDGINDYLTPILNCNPVFYKMLIFNRNGMLVFETNDIKNFWLGTYKGNNVPVGTYYYLINYRGISDGRIKQKAGSITLIR